MNFSKINELKPYDLNCNIFDVYSYDGLSMQELLCQFFTKINECVKTSNETIDLAEWLVNEGLKQEVALKLTTWLNDGTLENLINVTLFENLNKKIDNVTSQLEHIEKLQFITPECFEGTDFEKIQQSLDYAIANKMDLCINKKYTIDEELIINKPSDTRFKTTIFGGGTILRTGSGSIFSSKNKSTSDIQFDNISFIGSENSNITCFDCGNANLIRLKINNCHFSNLDYVIYTQSYLQTIYITNSTFVKINNAVMEFGGMFDVKISNIVYENSKGQFLNHLKIGQYSGCQSFSLRDSVLEGITGENDLIRISNPYAFSINNCYFEANNCKNIVFFNAYECAGVNISNNIHLGTVDESQAFITWSGILHDCITSCNSISGIKINDTTGITKGKVISQGDFCALSDKNITSNNTQVINPFNSNISTNINKVGSTNFIVSTEAERILNETLLCTIKTPINSGFAVRIKGGGFKGGVGLFAIELTYHIIKVNNDYTITEKDLDVTGGDSIKNDIICREDNDGNISIYVQSTNNLVSSYFLTMYIDGQVYSVK